MMTSSDNITESTVATIDGGSSVVIESLSLEDKRTELLGYPVHLITQDEGLGFVKGCIECKQTAHVITMNPEMLMQGEDDAELASTIKKADLVIADGVGLVWGLRHKGHKQAKKLPGIEFSEAMLRMASENGYSVALIGSKEDVLSHAVDKLRERFPAINIVFSHHGFFDTPEQAEVVAKNCADGRPAIVLVALGVPRQEKWIARYKDLFEASVLVGVGGSLDVWSGKSNRAPAWMRALSLEWLYRITCEPWRIKRTYKTLPAFVMKVLFSKKL